MNALINSHYEILKLNTLLFKNCFLDVDGDAAKKRIKEDVNSMAFIALHAIDARYFLAKILGETTESPFKRTLENVNSIDELVKYPKLGSILGAWSKISSILKKRFASLTEDVLMRDSPQPFPVEDKSLLGGIAFLLEHESFHIGQLALIRKYFGFDPMGYT